MRKLGAFILAGVEGILAVGVPIIIAMVFHLRPIPYLFGMFAMIAGMSPGISVMVLAGKLWREGAASKPNADQLPSGNRSQETSTAPGESKSPRLRVCEI